MIWKEHSAAKPAWCGLPAISNAGRRISYKLRSCTVSGKVKALRCPACFAEV